MPLIMLLAGAAIGGGGAYATLSILGPPAAADAHAAPAPVETSFVSVAKVMAPLVLADGRLSGYVSFDVDLQVATEKAPDVTAKLPLLLHAINMRTYRTPLAAGPDGMLPDIAGLRKVVMAAAPDAFGPGIVRRVAITRAEPA